MPLHLIMHHGGGNVVVTCPPDRVPLVGKEVRGTSIQAATKGARLLIFDEGEYVMSFELLTTLEEGQFN
jgi:hypothetical protein